MTTADDQIWLRVIVATLSARHGGLYPPDRADTINRLLFKWAALLSLGAL